MKPDHVAINRDYWNGYAPQWVQSGELLWASDPEWGIWGLPEAEVSMLPEDMSGMRAIELGCGTGYVSGWMVRRGAVATAVDQSIEQLATAKRLALKHKTEIQFIEANAEEVPLPDGGFDFAISEYGAVLWCEPERWLAEAHRLLRPGGELSTFASHPLTLIAAPPSGAALERVFHRPYRGMTGADWSEVEIDPGGIEFNRTFSDWFRLFREFGFEILDMREHYAPPDATGEHFFCPADWAKEYPSEISWRLRRV